MYKKIILISSFVCLFIGFKSIAQTVKTNLYVTLTPCDSLHFHACSGSHIADVTQEFILEKHTTDTLFLKLDKYNWLQSFAYPQHFLKLTVDIISKNKKQSVKPSFDGINLSIPLPVSSCTVKLNYFYNSDYTIRSMNSHAPHYVWPCEQFNSSWYFTCSDMQIDKVEFNNPYDSLLYLFVDAPTYRRNGKIILDMKQINKENINFYLFEKPFFSKTTCIEDANTINIYLDRGQIWIPTPDAFWNNIILPGNRATQALEDSCKFFISNALKKIKTIFPPIQGVVIDIFDADLSVNENTIAWGTAASDDNNKHHMVLIDTSMWRDHSLIHELIHLYNPIPYSKDDSTYYFFAESITEYLAVCFRYEDKQKRDLVFNQKIIYFAREPNDDYSIFKLSSNTRGGNTGRGSAIVVYDKTPFILHTLAQMIGEDKFYAVLKQFYAKVAEGMAINLPNFEQLLKENGLTDKQWDWFMRSL